MGRHLTAVGQPLPGVSDARGHIQAPMFLRRARRDLALVQRNLERTKAGSRRHAKALVRRPIAGETITYQIPTITLDGTAMLYFAGWKHHISLYPVPTGDEAFEQQVEPYRSAKSTLKFPLSEPIPYDLIEQVVRTPPRTAAGQQAHTLIAFRELG
jgi:uncharacterized protein YdhG (YjbR/CyaY superfamily)